MYSPRMLRKIFPAKYRFVDDWWIGPRKCRSSADLERRGWLENSRTARTKEAGDEKKRRKSGVKAEKSRKKQKKTTRGKKEKDINSHRRAVDFGVGDQVFLVLRLRKSICLAISSRRFILSFSHPPNQSTNFLESGCQPATEQITARPTRMVIRKSARLTESQSASWSHHSLIRPSETTNPDRTTTVGMNRLVNEHEYHL
jgi:hypothetical protein